MSVAASRILIARQLVGARVVDAQGRSVGKVVDLEVDVIAGWEVTGLELGRYGWLDRLHLLRPLFHGRPGHEPRIVAWRDIDRLEEGKLSLKRGALVVG